MSLAPTTVLLLVLIAHPGALDKYGGHLGPEHPGDEATYHCHKCPCNCTDVMQPREDEPAAPTADDETPASEAVTPAAEAPQVAPPAPPPPSPYAERRGQVQGVSPDGRLTLVGGERVRLLGVTMPLTRTPKTIEHDAAQEARKEIRRLAKGKTVTLQFEKGRAPRADLPPNIVEVYVQVTIPLRIMSLDGREQEVKEIPTDLGEHLLRRGLARVADGLHFRRKDAYLKAQARAQKARLGVWAAPPRP